MRASGGEACPIATAQSFAVAPAGTRRLVVDEARVYWMTSEDGVGTVHAAAR
jgi:hypothetical protein